MRGRPRTVPRKEEEEEDLKGLAGAEQTMSQILAERCGIPGCIAKNHREEAHALIRRFVNLGIIKDGN